MHYRPFSCTEVFQLYTHLAMLSSNVRDELCEYVRCRCVQKYIITKIRCPYREVEAATRSEKTTYSVLTLWISLSKHYKRPRLKNKTVPVLRLTCITSNKKWQHIRTTAYECKRTITYTLVLAYQPIDIFCINQYYIIYLIGRSLTTWESLQAESFWLTTLAENSAGIFWHRPAFVW